VVRGEKAELGQLLEGGSCSKGGGGGEGESQSRSHLRKIWPDRIAGGEEAKRRKNTNKRKAPKQGCPKSILFGGPTQAELNKGKILSDM